MIMKEAVDFAASKKLTHHYAKSFYLAAQFLPKEKREAAYAIYAFCRVSDNIVDHPGKHPQAELDEWKAATKDAFAKGKSNQPVLDAFVKTCQAYAVPNSYAFELLDGMQLDLEKNRYETFDELYDYCYRVASIPGLMMTHVFGYEDPLAKSHAVELGIAMQLTNILRDLHEDYQNGKIYLPQEELRRFGCIESDFGKEKMKNELQQLVLFQVSRANEYYQKSQQGIRMISPDSRLGVMLCRELYGGILTEIGKGNRRLHQRVVVSDWKKYLILIREYMRLQTDEWKSRA